MGLVTPRDALRQQLMEHEGVRLFPYVDTVGKVTIGIGHNLTDNGLTEAQVMALFEDDLAATIRRLEHALPWVKDLDRARYNVLVDIAFNAGVQGLLGFRRMLVALRLGDYATAATEIVDSRLAPTRAQTLARLMRTGE